MATILFPTDFSVNAENALHYVIPFARKMNARIILLHVFRISTPVMDTSLYLWDEEIKVQNQISLDKLGVYRDRIHATNPDLSVECVANFGFPVPNILIAAEEYEADWIIMGTKGASGLKRIFMGSITSQVISRANCPVLATPASEDFHGIHRIVYATNYELRELEALKKLSVVAEIFGAEIMLAHIGTASKPIKLKKWEYFQEAVRKALPHTKISFRYIPHEDLEDGLDELLEYSHAELLAMSPHKRSYLDRLFHGSNTRRVAQHIHTPLLSVPCK